jgi:hypothetical protein
MTIEGAPDGATLANVIGADGAGSLAMIAFPSGALVWLATGHTDMRKGFGSLALMHLGRRRQVPPPRSSRRQASTSTTSTRE